MADRAAHDKLLRAFRAYGRFGGSQQRRRAAPRVAPVRQVVHTLCTTFGRLSPLLAGTHTRRLCKRGRVMSGVVVFKSVREALNAGYQIYGKTEDGYLARMRTERGWALALIVIVK